MAMVLKKRTNYPESEARITAAVEAGGHGNLAEAARLYREEPADSHLHGVVLTGLAQVLGRLGLWDDAEQAARDAIADFETFGPAHPASWVLAHRILGERAADRHDLVVAEKHFAAACETADGLSEDALAEVFQDVSQLRALVREVTVEKGHVLNSHGGALLLAREPSRAVAKLEDAQKCYRLAGNADGDGVAETLTHLALAYRLIGDRHRAGLALREALGVATERGDGEQVFRVYVELHALDPSAPELPAQASWRVEAAERAEREGQRHVAYVRWCLAAEHLLDLGDLTGVENALQRATSLEHGLPDDHLERAALRKTMAEVRLRQKDEPGALAALLDGARRWSKVVSQRSETSDVEQVNRLMHEHFRVLTKQLLADHRYEEAFCAFEHGRSLAHALTIDPSLRKQLHGEEGLADTGSFPVALLDNVRKRLGSMDAIVSALMLPQELVAFVVRLGDVSVHQEPLEPGTEEGLVDALNALPSELNGGKGQNAVPAIVGSLASRIAKDVACGAVLGLFPHALLHTVPWRVLLHVKGIPWERLDGVTGFGVALWAAKAPAPAIVGPAVSLGFGQAGGVNFEDEAVLFADRWGTGADVQEATPGELGRALTTAEVVHLSCHGKRVDDDVLLMLKDDSVSICEVLGDRKVVATLVLLSACYSGTYFVRFGDHALGPVPDLLRRGARFCIGTRFPISAAFTEQLFPLLGEKLSRGEEIGRAFSAALGELESAADLWTDIACVELLGS
jgi:tetratricopeptide (TPR) repeat protein